MNKNIKILTYLSICLIINYIGSSLALLLRLPIYIDTIGTMIASITIGPLFGSIVAISFATLSWLTNDIYALYYLPVAIIIALLSGFIYSKKPSININIIFTSLFISISATFLASIITVVLFKGITSSGSSIIVQFLHGIGLSLTTSVILVQIVTDYIDKLFSLFIALSVAKYGFINNIKNKF